MSAAPQPQPAPQPSQAPHKAFFTTLPGVLTGVAGTVGTILALVTALNEATWLHRDKVTPTPATVVAQVVVVTPTPQAETPAGQQAASISTQQNTPLPPTPGVTLTDDFSDATSGWQIQSEGELWSLGYVDGQYQVYAADSTYSVFGQPVQNYELANLALEVDAQQVSGPVDGTYGVIVRERDDDTFYLFAIASDLTYAVYRTKGDDWQALVDWTESVVVKPLGEVNHLKLECVGPTMRFAVNGVLLAEVSDDTYPSGNIGLLVETTDEGAMDVRFDNLQVRPLEGF
jgi:hypothetical protein